MFTDSNGKNTNNAIVHIYESEISAIVAEAQRFPSSETGGDLYGTFTHGNMPVIWLASGPGPKAKHQNTHFEQDVGFINYWQERLMKDFGVQYIGTWHSHHVLSLKQPSEGDIGAARKYAIKHNRRSTLEIIVNHEGHQLKTNLRPFFYPNAQKSSWVLTQFNPLSGESPLRSRLGSDEQMFSSNINWRKMSIDPVSSLSTYQSTSNQSDMPYSNSDADDYPSDTDDYPSGLVKALKLLDIEDIEIEQRGNFFMTLISISTDKDIAFALDASNKIQIVQVNLIDRSQPTVTNEDITQLVRENGISLTIDKYNLGVMRDVLYLVKNLECKRKR